jgi:hypothetical protein
MFKKREYKRKEGKDGGKGRKKKRNLKRWW